jgi:hypothetical protein
VERHTTLWGEDPSELYEADPGLASMSLREFYHSKRPSDHKDRIAIFAYWLTKKEDKQGPGRSSWRTHCPDTEDPRKLDPG